MSAPRQSGFTLTELVLILVLVGILAAFVAPRLNIEGFQRQAFGLELLNALRYAQKTAIGTGCPIQASVNAAADTYTLNYTGAGGPACGGSASPLPHPTRSGAFTGSGAIDSGGTVVFDGRGETASGLSIALAGGRVITVEAGTGYVHD
jgi:MSHA pilin protein MshC